MAGVFSPSPILPPQGGGDDKDVMLSPSPLPLPPREGEVVWSGRSLDGALPRGMTFKWMGGGLELG